MSWALACILAMSMVAVAGDAPSWMHALVNAPLPAHDGKTDAVLLYSERVVTVVSPDKIHRLVREAYKILRPNGRDRGFLAVPFSANENITHIRGWCIPAQGKDFEVKEKDSAEVSLPKIDGSELVTDLKSKVLQIPASEPGNIVGYEYEIEEQPYVLQDVWYIQEGAPVREARYTLQLPPGWEYKTTWLNLPEVKPSQSGRQWSWVVTDVKGMRYEEAMPPVAGVAGQMILAFYPPEGGYRTFSDWRQMGEWYLGLTRSRADASPELKQKVVALTAGASDPLAKIRAIARFAQKDVRYVAIELGIGGWQPHPASEVFSHRYGDCKDKSILMMAMLREAGIESYYVVIYTQRGRVTPKMQAHYGAFNHVILAIKLPPGVAEADLHATAPHARLGKLLFFDPTNEFVPLGEIAGHLQANYGLLVTPQGGELLELPRQPAAMNGIRRKGTLVLSSWGTLTGDFQETRVGDRASEQRAYMRGITKESERIKPIESLLSHSLTAFQIVKAQVPNPQETSQAFDFSYSIQAPNYAKTAGNLLLVRPRVVGSKAREFLETKEPRQFPVEFEGPSQDTDVFEITLPKGYEVEELPRRVDVDMDFASYHSKSEVDGGVLRYTRTLEFKQLSVPVNKVEELRKFYRIITNDERNAAVLRPAKADQ